MKVKYFLRGLGVGIIVTALVLCISYRNTKPSESIVEQAKKLGMVFPEKTSQPTFSSQPTETPAVSGSAIKEKEENEATSAPTEKATSKPTPEATKKPTEKVEKDTITFTVRGGLLSSSVAREMKEQGVIDDNDAFDEYIEENGYGKEIRAGTYKIPKNASYEEIAKIITRQD